MWTFACALATGLPAAYVLGFWKRWDMNFDTECSSCRSSLT